MQKNAIKVSVRTDFDFSSESYHELFVRAGSPCFGHPIWLDEIRRILPASRGLTHRVLVAEEDGGRLRLVTPLVTGRILGTGYVRSADFGVSDYTDPVVAAEDLPLLATDDELRRAVMEAVGSPALLRLPRVRDEPDAVAQLFGGGLAPAPHSAHEIALPPTAAQWVAGLSRSTRQALSRRRRQAEADDSLRFERLETDAIPWFMEKLRAFRCARFPAAEDALQSQDAFRVYRAAAERGVALGFVRLYALFHKGRLVALDYCIASGGTTCSLLRGLAPDAEPSLSFGNTMLALIVEDCIAAGDRVLDLAAGDEEYKARFGAVPRPLAIVVAHRGLAGVLTVAAARSTLVRSVARRWSHALRHMRRTPGHPAVASPGAVGPDRVGPDSDGPGGGSGGHAGGHAGEVTSSTAPERRMAVRVTTHGARFHTLL